MKKKLQLLACFILYVINFAQTIKPVARELAELRTRKVNFIKSRPFTVEASVEKHAKFKQAAKDVVALKLDRSQLNKILDQKPNALELTFPFESSEITVELMKVDIFSAGFDVHTDKGEITTYTPGIYYRGTIKGDTNSLVAFSFFDNDVVGITSVKDGGNIVLGKALNSDDFVVYDDRKLKGENTFICSSDELMQDQLNKVSFDPKRQSSHTTTNCVRVYYEICNKVYVNNDSDITSTINWMTAVHNNVNTLYVNDYVKLALSSIYIWTTLDPYRGTADENLEKFSLNRQNFEGDVAHLITTGLPINGVAKFNSLCTSKNYAYSSVQLTYNNVPSYSWTINVITHEMGHSFGSLHTHACAWNGNNTAIDGCGPVAGYNEGCTGQIPAKGTIMSYCHLFGSVGISFANGFGEQPGALIRANIDTKACLGTNCIVTCPTTVSSVIFKNVTKTGFTADINDNISTSWKYSVTKMDDTIVKSGITTDKVLTTDGLNPNTYYRLLIGTLSCELDGAFQTNDIFLTNDEWCGKTFTDSGGTTDNYSYMEHFVKTFYPDSADQKLTLTFNNFNLEENFDFMNIKDGPSISSPDFEGGKGLTGNSVPGPFVATDPTGAITIEFISDDYIIKSGWEAVFSCSSLNVSDINEDDNFSILPNPVKDNFKIGGYEKIKSVKILDASAKLVKIFDKEPISRNVYDLSNLKAGNYLLIINSEYGIVSKKLIKQ